LFGKVKIFCIPVASFSSPRWIFLFELPGLSVTVQHYDKNFGCTEQKAFPSGVRLQDVEEEQVPSPRGNKVKTWRFFQNTEIFAQYVVFSFCLPQNECPGRKSFIHYIMHNHCNLDQNDQMSALSSLIMRFLKVIVVWRVHSQHCLF